MYQNASVRFGEQMNLGSCRVVSNKIMDLKRDVNTLIRAKAGGKEHMPQQALTQGMKKAPASITA